MAFTSSKVVLLRRSLSASAIVASLVSLGGLAALSYAFGVEAFIKIIQGTAAFLAYIVAAIVIAWRMRGSSAVGGLLYAGEEGVRLDDRLVCARGDITAGFVIPGDAGLPEVRLVRRFPHAPIRLRVPDEATGRELLEGLGLDAGHTTATLELASMLRARSYASAGNVACLLALPAILVAFLFGQASGGVGGFAAAALLGVGVALWVVLNLIPSRLHIGADGVLVEWLGQRTFVDFQELVRARMFIGSGTAGVALDLRNGDEVLLPAMGLFKAELPRDELTLLVKRIEQAAEVQRRAQADRGVLLPPRGERTAREWLGHLRALGSGANADHRTAPVQADTLFRIAADPGTEPARRIAAAVALRGGLDDEGRSRLRIAASTTAVPELREVLELAASEEATEDALAAAIDRVMTARS